MLTRKNVANGFNQSGSGYGVVKIDMNKVTSDSYKGYDIYPRVNGVEGLPYHYSVWQQEISVYQMNSAGGRCHDNARCESMWARFKAELLYGRYDTSSMTVAQLKTIIWRYFISYWNHRRICSANGGLTPMVKRQQYYASLQESA